MKKTGLITKFAIVAIFYIFITSDSSFGELILSLIVGGIIALILGKGIPWVSGSISELFRGR